MTGISRRKLIMTGLATAAGACGLGVAARLADRYGLIPPDHGGIYGAGETLTYAAQRLLMSRHSLYERLAAGGFVDWRLMVDGLIARPISFSLAELKRLPSRTQITHQACEEGWSFIAEWTGVALSDVLHLAGVRREAKYVVFFPFDVNWDSIDMADAWHPQTLLAYAMNGQELPAAHGAPVRLRVPRQLGYKSVKYLSRITVTDRLQDIGSGLGSISPEIGYSWYAGI